MLPRDSDENVKSVKSALKADVEGVTGFFRLCLLSEMCSTACNVAESVVQILGTLAKLVRQFLAEQSLISWDVFSSLFV